MIEERLNGRPVVIQLPIGKEQEFHGVVDLVTMAAHYWPDQGMGEQWEDRPIPEEMRDEAEQYRHDLVEALADYDETIMERYIGEEKIEAELIRKALRKATIANEITPVLCGSAFKNKAVQPLLDAIC
jgi:elongation factor G